MSIKPEAKVEPVEGKSLSRPILCTTETVPDMVKYYNNLARSGDGDQYSESQKIVTFYPQTWESDQYNLEGVERIYLVYKSREAWA